MRFREVVRIGVMASLFAGVRIEAATLTVGSSGAMYNLSEFQRAINDASLGDTITIRAGETVTGNFVLPNKGNGESFITITTDAPGNVPAVCNMLDAGCRASFAAARAAMPKIVSSNVAPALRSDDSAHHYRFVGVEIATSHAVKTTTHSNIVLLGYNSSGAMADSELKAPHHIEFDRIYMHGTRTGNVVRGIAFNAFHGRIENSWIDEIHSDAQDAQTIAAWNGTRYLWVLNNYLEASGENVVFGGADPAIRGSIPSDIVVSGNYMTKPLRWFSKDPSWDGSRWLVKNVFELKNAQRVRVNGNIFEHAWMHGQTGFIILIQGVNDGGRCTWCTIKDVVFTNNVVRHGNGGIALSGHVAYGGKTRGPASDNIVVRNNLFYDISGSRWGAGSPLGWFAQLGADYARVTIDHNTADADGGAAIMLANAVGPGLTITNNLMRGNAYGVAGNGTAPGVPSLTTHARGGYTFLANVLASDAHPPSGGVYPPTTLLPSLSDFFNAFVDRAAGNYRLKSASRYAGAANDGTDIGVNMDQLGAALNANLQSAATIPHPPSNVRLVR